MFVSWYIYVLSCYYRHHACAQTQIRVHWNAFLAALVFMVILQLRFVETFLAVSGVDIMDVQAGFSFGAYGIHFGIVGLPQSASFDIVRFLGPPALPFSGEPIASVGRDGSVCVSWVIRIPFHDLDPVFLERTQYVHILSTDRK